MFNLAIKSAEKHVSTSYAERQNLNIRMGNPRMTRLANAANHAHMMAIYFMHYNFVRIHQTLKVTPAMAAGVTPKLWEMADTVKVLEDWEQSVSFPVGLMQRPSTDDSTTTRFTSKI
jgi:hypothetical protein